MRCIIALVVVICLALASSAMAVNINTLKNMKMNKAASLSSNSGYTTAQCNSARSNLGNSDCGVYKETNVKSYPLAKTVGGYTNNPSAAQLDKAKAACDEWLNLRATAARPGQVKILTDPSCAATLATYKACTASPTFGCSKIDSGAYPLLY